MKFTFASVYQNGDRITSAAAIYDNDIKQRIVDESGQTTLILYDQEPDKVYIEWPQEKLKNMALSDEESMYEDYMVSTAEYSNVEELF